MQPSHVRCLMPRGNAERVEVKSGAKSSKLPRASARTDSSRQVGSSTVNWVRRAQSSGGALRAVRRARLVL